MITPWYQLTIADAVQQLDTHVAEGLNSAEPKNRTCHSFNAFLGLPPLDMQNIVLAGCAGLFVLPCAEIWKRVWKEV